MFLSIQMRKKFLIMGGQPSESDEGARAGDVSCEPDDGEVFEYVRQSSVSDGQEQAGLGSVAKILLLVKLMV